MRRVTLPASRKGLTKGRHKYCSKLGRRVSQAYNTGLNRGASGALTDVGSDEGEACCRSCANRAETLQHLFESSLIVALV